LGKKPRKDSSEDEVEESAGDRWLHNGIVFFLVLPLAIYLGWISHSLLGYLLFAGFGGALTIWRVAVTPEIRNKITINFNLKGRKQVVKGSPGGSVTQADTIYQIGVPRETSQIPPNLVTVYTTMRKVVKGWLDPRWSYFADWSRLDDDDPHSVIQIRRTAPDLADLFDQASSLFEKIHSLRESVNVLIEDEQERLVQEFQSKFDSGSKVKFSFFRISSDGSNDNTLYLIHAWMQGQDVREYAEFTARERLPNLKTWKLELMVVGHRVGNPVSESIATGEEAIKFGQRVLDYLEMQESARKLREELKRVQEFRKAILPLIERELSKS